MDCAKVFRKLSSYIDNELGAEEKQLVSEHVAHCEKCAAELRLLQSEETCLRQLQPIQTSSDFRARFWERVRNEEISAANRKTLWDRIIQSWIPIPVACSILIVLFSAFSALSPLLYAMPDTNKSKAIQLTTNTLTGISGNSIFSPINFVKFCNSCHEMLCESCQKGESCPVKKCRATKCTSINMKGEVRYV